MVQIDQLFHVGNIDAFAFAKVANASWHTFFAMPRLVIQFTAAVVNRVRVVVSNSLPAQIIEGCLQTPRDDLWDCGMGCILERFNLVLLRNVPVNCDG